ncbi:MAG: Endolytic murein transglycosylase [Parcubacteria group bacterium]|nr:Endolytic murein transglycosylase [Parcubacteria group bacterium]
MLQQFFQPYITGLRTLSRTNRILFAGLIAGTIVSLGVAWLFSAPSDFPTNQLITIPKGASGLDFANDLAASHVIRSPFAFRVLSRISGLDRSLDPGTYLFTQPVMLSGIVTRIGNAEHGINPIRITLTEGMTTKDIDATFVAELPGFDSAAFLKDASTSEGYLFPDTYFFMPGTDSNDIVVRLRTQFSAQIASITPQILSSKRSVNDAVIMASILEREANSPEDMRMVAGILWNRINKGLPLQVDATFGYIHAENGYTPTAADLSSDSPYNTYRNKGLPPGPISNPGLDALLAAVTPTKTNDLYYLTGKDGKMHYATTFEQHKKNRALYLD